MAGSNVSLLEIELDRLQTAVNHLLRSNKELRSVQEQDNDPEYRQAIGENIVVVCKYRAQIAALEEEIERARSQGRPAEGSRVALDDDAGCGAAAVGAAAPQASPRPAPAPPVPGDVDMADASVRTLSVDAGAGGVPPSSSPQGEATAGGGGSAAALGADVLLQNGHSQACSGPGGVWL